MMLDFSMLVRLYNIKIKGIIQLGSHLFQERDVFTALGVKDFVLVEPQKNIFNQLPAITTGLNTILFNCAVSDVEGKFEMQIDTNNNGESGSLLEAKDHLIKYPQITFTKRELVDVKRVENLPFDRSKYNCLIMDLQGNELKALKGSGNLLNHIDCIYTEVNFEELYKDCVLLKDLDLYLAAFNFKRVALGDNYNNQGWSDAFYLKNN